MEISPLTQASGKRRSRLSRTHRSNSDTVTTPAFEGGGGLWNSFGIDVKGVGEPPLYPHLLAVDAKSRQIDSRKPILLSNALFVHGKTLLKF